MREGVRGRRRAVGRPRRPAPASRAARCRSPTASLIVTSRMKRVLEIDLANQRICVEPGVTNTAVSSAVAPDLFYPPDPSSQIVCSIGGNVAENSGGAHCFKYGFTTNYVCGLEVVLPDGELVTLGGRELDPPGYDLLGAFVGSEGTLGIATKVWLRVMPVARDGQDARRVLRLHPRRRRGGVGDRAVRRRPRRDRDDGPRRDRGQRADGARRLPGRPRRGAAGRARRRRARVRGALRGGRRGVRALRLRRRARRPRRDRAPAVLEDAQGRVPRHGPDLAELLRPGRRDPADQAARGARGDRRARGGVRHGRRQRLPRRRRQPPSAGVLRRAQRGRGGARRGAVGPHPRRLPGRRRLDHRRARRRRRQEEAHAEDVRARPTSTRSSACAARGIRPGSPTRAR